jgi:hypothetical protein
VVAALVALTAAACSSTSGGRQIFMPDLPKQTSSFSTTEREHQRVLAAYGGAYEDP